MKTSFSTLTDYLIYIVKIFNIGKCVGIYNLFNAKCGEASTGFKTFASAGFKTFWSTITFVIILREHQF